MSEKLGFERRRDSGHPGLSEEVLGPIRMGSDGGMNYDAQVVDGAAAANTSSDPEWRLPEPDRMQLGTHADDGGLTPEQG